MARKRPHGGTKICGAKLRSPGKHGDWKCHKAPMPNGKCYRHGGKTPAGIASPHFKTGKHSKYLKHLPLSFAPHFNPDNPHLVALTEELALVEAGVVDALQRAGGRMTAKVRHEIWELVERKARLVAVESRRLKDEHEMVSRDQFARFAGAIMASVAAHVVDVGARGKIQEEVLRILALSNVPALTGALAS